MGWFGFLKKKKEDVAVRTLKLDKMDEHLQRLLETKYKSVLDDITEQKTIIQDCVNKIEGLTRALSKEELQNKNIPYRIMSIMEGNRINYVKQYQFFLEKISLPDDPFALPAGCRQYTQELAKLGDAIAKNQAVLSEFFDHTIRKINKNVVEMTHAFDTIRTLTTGAPFSVMNAIKDTEATYAAKRKRRDALTQEITELDEQLQLMHDKEQKLIKQIEQLSSSKEHADYLRAKDELAALAAQQKRETESFLILFSNVQKALIKHKRSSDHERLIDDYLMNVLETLERDEQFMLTQIFDEVKLAVQNGKVALEDKKKEKTLETIAKLDRDTLQDTRARVLAYRAERERLQAQLKRDTVSLALEQQKNYLQQNILRVQTLEDKKKQLEHERDLIDFPALLSSIGEKIEQLSGMKTVITNGP